MRKRFSLIVALGSLFTLCSSAQNKVFIYSPHPTKGLHIAVEEGREWKDLGQLCSSDYGTWGAEKKMYHPSLCRAKDGSWRLVFQVNDYSPVLAAAYSRDLVTWRPQDYPRVAATSCLSPVVQSKSKAFTVFYRTKDNVVRSITASNDFRRFTKDEAVKTADSKLWNRDTIEVDGQKCGGQFFMLSADEMGKIRTHFKQQSDDWRLSSERMHDDGKNLSLPSAINARLTVYPDSTKAISDKLIGIFFEDISYAADGGLYAELIQNRDFEYSSKDRGGWNATTAWKSASDIVIKQEQPLTPQNPHYAVVTNKSLENEGWDGIPIEQGKGYDFSMFVKGNKTFYVTLRADDGTILGTGRIRSQGDEWKRYECPIIANKSDQKARLVLMPEGNNEAAIDMVSLFPQETFKNRKNGLRKDLAEVIAALQPKFVRFPGGCMSHGQGLDNIYHWNHTVGPLESRTPDFNIWHYHQTRGLGFYEYFQFCEDIGAEPLPVLAAGVPCQNSANNSEGVGGQQGGIPMEQMPAYIEELCNLIEWANGDPTTNEWARMRAEAGHPEPFNLKYLGIGNEDIISTVFEERYEMICKAIRKRYPDIRICGTVGPFHTPSADYIEGWDFTKKQADLQYMTDEHYYESTGWFVNHRNYYDNYDRNAPKVYLGEWAASTKVKRPNVETALAEALYLTDIERNGDVVVMTSYAPMLCKDGHSNWNPDMIYFTNTHVRTTPAYEIQRLFSVNSGDRYVFSEIKMADDGLAHVNKRIGASVVSDSKSGRRYLKLVNALPATLNISVEGISLPKKVRCTQFTGSIEDQKTKAETIETDTPATLPPYSMRVIEL